MYLLMPALYVVAGRASTARPLGALYLLAVLLGMLWARVGAPSRLGLLPDVACFLAGVAAFRWSRGAAPLWPPMVWPATLAMATAAYLRSPTFVVGWACCLLLAWVLPRVRELPEGRVRHAARLIARFSYGIYLTHFVCMWIAFQVLSQFPLPLRLLAFAALVALLPVALYYWIEAPMVSAGSAIAARVAGAGLAPRKAEAGQG